MFLKKLEIKSRNIPLMYIASVMSGMVFFAPILALYLEESLFTVTNIAIVFSVKAFALALFEIPTGAIADLFGRKNAKILAYFFHIMAIVFLYIGGTIEMFIAYGVLSAFGRSLSSGTNDALIYDTLKEEGKEKYYKKVIGIYHALWPMGASMAGIIGGYLAKVSLELPVAITFIPLVIALTLAFFLKEPEYEKETHKNIFRQMTASLKTVVKSRQLIIIFFGSLLITAVGEAFHVLRPLFLQFKEIPVEYFGYVFAVIFALGSIGHFLSYSVSERLGNKKSLLLFVTVSPLFIILSTFTGGLVMLCFIVIPPLFFGLRRPVINHFINIEATSSQRATVLSIGNFLRYLGMGVMVPFIGYLAEVYNINMSFRIIGLMLFIAPVIFIFMKDRE